MRMRMRILSSSSRPISSPGRTDKFPPPLMRFLRTDISSRSRGRSSSKASPLFFRRKKSVVDSRNGIETTQEPSSPKVTCIGQVRVRRSKNNQSKKLRKSKKRKNDINNNNYRFCRWLRRPRVCLRCFRLPKWKWSWIFLFNCRDVGRVRTTAVSSSKNSGSARFEETAKEARVEALELKPKRRFEISCFDDEDGMYESGRRSSVSEMGTAATTPPKNAFMLTRSRSSSLATRFWTEEEEEEKEKEKEKEEDDIDDKNEEGEGEGEEDDGLEMGRRSCASEMGTSATTAAAPPKNAFLLTRCKSTSLACRFWVDGGESSDKTTEDDKKNSAAAAAAATSKGDQNSESESESESTGVCAAAATEGGHGKVELGEFILLPSVKSEEGKKSEEGNLGEGVKRAVKLRRCKSEPARRDVERYDPESSEFWRLRRFSSASATHHLH